jgi:hypothetical protein
MKPIFVRPATLADARDVAARLREEDRQEVLAAGGMDPRIVFPAQVLEGREVLAAGIEGGPPEILFGCDPVVGAPEVGVVWLVSTPVLYDHPVEFVVTSRQLFQRFHERFRVLTNFVDERNVRHIKWLKWLGFIMVRRVERYGAQSRPFIEFASVRLQSDGEDHGPTTDHGRR